MVNEQFFARLFLKVIKVIPYKLNYILLTMTIVSTYAH